MNFLSKIIFIIACIMALFAAMLLALDSGLAKQQAYATTNDCRYESGVCYKYQERGYLWPAECRADKACRDMWGL